MSQGLFGHTVQNDFTDFQLSQISFAFKILMVLADTKVCHTQESHVPFAAGSSSCSQDSSAFACFTSLVYNCFELGTCHSNTENE